MSSNITFHPLSDPEVASSLRFLHRSVLDVIGPYGRLSLIPGGASSCSSRLLGTSLIVNKNPTTKALTRVVISTAQVLTENDGALWFTAMCLGLLQGCDDDDSNPGPAMSQLGSMFTQCLKDISLPLDLSCISHLKTLVESVLGSKPGSGITPRDRRFLTGLILEAFLGLIPNPNETETYNRVPAPTKVRESFYGKLYDCDPIQMNYTDTHPSLPEVSAQKSPQMSSVLRGKVNSNTHLEEIGTAHIDEFCWTGDKPHKCNANDTDILRNSKIVPEQKGHSQVSLEFVTCPDPGHIRLIFIGGLDVRQSSIFPGLLIKLTDPSSRKLISSLLKGSEQGIKTLLLTDSVPGEVPIKNFEGRSRRELEEAFIEEEWVGLQRLVEKERLRIIFCQKVVHPKLKKRFTRLGILVLDKLGAETVRFLKLITGSDVGTVSSIEEKTVGRDIFFLLRSSKLYSLLLCCYGEQPGQELMAVCRQANDALFQVMSSARLSFGAGCGEVMAMEKLFEKLDSESTLKSYTPGQVEASCKALMHALRIILSTLHRGHTLGVASGHLWRVDPHTFMPLTGGCACGGLKVPDNVSSKFHCVYLPAWKGCHFTTPTIEESAFVLDELSGKIRSLDLAFETASLLLRTAIVVDNSSPIMS